MKCRQFVGFTIAAIMFVVVTIPCLGVETTDHLATNITLYIGRPAPTGVAKTDLSPGLQIISPGRNYVAGADVVQLKTKLKKSFGLAEIVATPAMSTDLVVGKEQQLTAQAGTMKFRLTLLSVAKYDASYLVRTYEGDTLLNESKVEITRGNRGIVGGRDGEIAPYFFLVIEPQSTVKRIGGNIVAPEIISRIQPKYPEEMRKTKVSGTVILQAVVDEAGNVANIHVIESPNVGLNEATVEALKQWKYKPALADGKPVPVYLTLTVTYSLKDDQVEEKDNKKN